MRSLPVKRVASPYSFNRGRVNCEGRPNAFFKGLDTGNNASNGSKNAVARIFQEGVILSRLSPARSRVAWRGGRDAPSGRPACFRAATHRNSDGSFADRRCRRSSSTATHQSGSDSATLQFPWHRTLRVHGGVKTSGVPNSSLHQLPRINYRCPRIVCLWANEVRPFRFVVSWC